MSGYVITPLLPPQASNTSSSVSTRRMLRWCVMWWAAWRTQSLTLLSCSQPWCACGPTQASRSASAAPESTSSTIQRSSMYSTCTQYTFSVCVCACVHEGQIINLPKVSEYCFILGLDIPSSMPNFRCKVDFIIHIICNSVNITSVQLFRHPFYFYLFFYFSPCCLINPI